jgi:hypothetical protein
MEVLGRQARIWVLSVIAIAIDVPVRSAALNREEDCAPPALPLSFNSSFENAFAQGIIYFRGRTRIGVAFKNGFKDNFVLRSWQIFGADSLVTLCATAEDNFVHTLTFV